MDIEHLIDRLEELFNESRSFPLTKTVFVDEDRMLDIIDQMRISIPEEIKKARQLIQQKDRLLAQAQEEASRKVALAEEKVAEMISRDAIVEQAQARAEQILSQARADATATRKDADDYVLDSLNFLERELDKLNTQVRNGIMTIETERYREQNSPEV